MLETFVLAFNPVVGINVRKDAVFSVKPYPSLKGIESFVDTQGHV